MAADNEANDEGLQSEVISLWGRGVGAAGEEAAAVPVPGISPD